MSSSAETAGDGVMMKSRGEETTSPGLRKFQKGFPIVLGAVHVTIGIIMLLTAIVMAAVDLGFVVLIVYWGIIIYIAAGVLTIFTAKTLTKSMVCGTLVINIVATVAAAVGSILHFFAAIVLAIPPCHTINGHSICIQLSHTEIAMVAFSVLEIIVSLWVASFAVLALCSHSREEPTVEAHESKV
ncbi:uncharacterized protein ACJ7VT_019129 isoform 1-T2 [Polymixia lowei]